MRVIPRRCVIPRGRKTVGLPDVPQCVVVDGGYGCCRRRLHAVRLESLVRASAIKTVVVVMGGG